MKEKRLTVSVFASNMFNKYSSFKSKTSGEGFSSTANYRFSRMRYGCSVSYRIGELKASVKKVARSMNNDDVKGGGDNTGGESN